MSDSRDYGTTGPLTGLVHPLTIIRLAVGVFYLPHALSKVIGFAGTVGFFARAGFPAPEFFVVLALVLELIVAIAMIANVGVRYAAILSIGLMAVAALAQFITKGPGWYWARGGIEYLVFWGLASVAVFLDDWRRHPGIFGAFRTL